MNESTGIVDVWIGCVVGQRKELHTHGQLNNEGRVLVYGWKRVSLWVEREGLVWHYRERGAYPPSNFISDDD